MIMSSPRLGLPRSYGSREGAPYFTFLQLDADIRLGELLGFDFGAVRRDASLIALPRDHPEPDGIDGAATDRRPQAFVGFTELAEQLARLALD
jgi:hypothetical protein